MADKISSKSFHFASYTEKDRTEKVERKGFVSYGKDNDFPDYLNELYENSPTHHALVDSIAYMIAGKLDSDDLNAKLFLSKFDMQKLAREIAFDLKLHGAYFIEVIRTQGGGFAEVNRIPANKMRATEKNEDGEIDQWAYCNDWKNWRKEGIENIEVHNPKVSQSKFLIVGGRPITDGGYYPKPDYMGALNYVELEREISAFHINNIKNGLFPSAFLIWKNGIPTVTERNKLMAEMESDLAGAKNAGKIVNLFADGQESAPEVVAFNSNDADAQYEFLSKECTDKIMIGHRVVTPAIFGVKTAGQLGQQGELETGSVIFEERVIEPDREIILETLHELLLINGITGELYIDSNNSMMPKEEANVEQSFTGVQISSAVDIVAKVQTGELSREQAIQLLISLLGFDEEAAENMFPQTLLSKDPLQELLDAGEEVDEDEWEMISSEKIEGIPIDMEKELFARVPRNNPSGNSRQDNEIFRVRYRYAPKRVSDDSREFCRKMVGADKVYRKEDIDRASRSAVNPGWGPRGADNYNLWLYKGGGNCHHFWERRVYMRKNNKKITVNEARRIINQLDPSERAEARLPQNDPRVAQRPTDMPNKGFLNPR